MYLNLITIVVLLSFGYCASVIIDPVVKETQKKYGTTCDHICDCGNLTERSAIHHFENEACMILNVTGYTGFDENGLCFKMSDDFEYSASYSGLYFKIRGPMDGHVYLEDEFKRHYEIVLGAHKNTRTDIRKGSDPKTVESERTRGILKADKFRSFYIENNFTSGWIRAYSVEKRMLLTAWQDTSPINVDYFSFGSYGNVNLQFAFNCTPTSNASEMYYLQNLSTGSGIYKPDYPEQENVTLEPTPYPDPKLRKHLLLNRHGHEYDRVALPFSGGRHGTTIEISFTVTYYSIREQEQTLEVHGWPQFMWHDSRLEWDKSGRAEGFLHFQVNEIWLPDLVVYNGARPEKLEYYGRTNCLVNSSGMVMWVPPSRIDTYCTLNILKWPRDTQMCTVKIGSWSYHEEQVDVTLGYLKLNDNLEVDNTEWILLSMKGYRESKIYSCCPRDHYSSIIFKFELKRRSSGFFYTVVMPIALMCFTNVLVFWLPPVGGERIVLGALNFIGSLLLLMFIRTQLPNANRVPYIVMLCAWNMILATIGMITSVVVSSVGRLTAAYKLPMFIKNAYKPQLLSFLCIGLTPPETPKITKRLSIKGNRRLGGLVGSHDEDKRTKEEIEKEEEANRNKADWEILASFIDRLSFVLHGTITLFLLITLM